MIDKYWREFLNGSNIMFVRALIQDTLESFFKFMRENNFYDEDPYRVQAFEKAINTKDLQLIQNIYSQDFSFYYQVPSSKKIESIDARIIQFKDKFKKIIGFEDYNYRLQIGESIVTQLETYTKFFVSARNIGFHRNKESHDKSVIDETGYALEVASDFMTIVDCTPVTIRDQETLLKLKTTLNRLLKEILNKEDPSILPFEDNEVEEPQAERHGQPKFITNLEEKINEIIEISTDSKMGIFTVTDILKDLKAFSDTANAIQDTQKNIEAGQKNIENILEQQKIDLEDDIYQNSVDGSNVNPKTNFNKDSARYKTISNKKVIKNSPDKSKVAPLTPQTALNELIKYQSKFKNKFKCKNWENLAQGPFREEIFNHKITNKKSFLENDFVQKRYGHHSKVMDAQIDSDLGEEFFSTLSRIIF